MTGRLILSIITTIIWEAMLAGVWLWGLPALGIRLSPILLIVAMALLAAWATFGYRAGSRALRRKVAAGMSDLSGATGKAVKPLTPQGMVLVDGELWTARSTEGNIGKGEEVEVVRQEGFKLLVRRKA